MTCTVEGLTHMPPFPRRSTRRRYLLQLEAQGWRLVDHAAMKTKERVVTGDRRCWTSPSSRSASCLLVTTARPAVGFDSHRLVFD